MTVKFHFLHSLTLHTGDDARGVGVPEVTNVCTVEQSVITPYFLQKRTAQCAQEPTLRHYTI
jgi:hypothetical protein